jgi:hypothetical protein
MVPNHLPQPLEGWRTKAAGGRRLTIHQKTADERSASRANGITTVSRVFEGS